MQLTRAADYALRVMIHLASQPDGTKLRLKVLSAAADAPETFLGKLLQSLCHAGLVVSSRGPDGGFELAGPARNATVLDVVEAIEGPLTLNACLTEAGCDRKSRCPAHPVWTEAQQALAAVLRKSTIHDLAIQGKRNQQSLSERVPPAQFGVENAV